MPRPQDLRECAGGPRGGRGEPVSHAIWADAMGRKACARALAESKLSVAGEGGALTCAHKGQSRLLDNLTASPSASSALTIFMPPMAEHTIWLACGFTKGEATETPTNSTNHTSTRRARRWALRRVCMGSIMHDHAFHLDRCTPQKNSRSGPAVGVSLGLRFRPDAAPQP